MNADGRHWLQLQLAARILRAGGVIAHATEGVWGLACDPFDQHAVARLLALKQRPVAQGLILIGGDSTVFQPELERLSAPARQRVLAAWPGAHTFVVPQERFPNWVTGRHREVAVRVPDHAQARRLCERFGGPLVSTSANPSGRVAATSMLKVNAYFTGRANGRAAGRTRDQLDYVLPGCVGSPGRASAIQFAESGGWIRRRDAS